MAKRSGLRSLAAVLGCTAIAALAAVSPAREVSVTAGGRDITLTALNDDIIRVYSRPAGCSDTLPASRSVVLGMRPAYTQVERHGDTTILMTRTTRATVDPTTGRISFCRADGSPLIAEATGLDNTPGSRRASFITPRGESFYGAGERGHRLRLNGDTLLMYNKQNYGYSGSEDRISQMNISVPWLLSSAGWGILFDDYNEAALTVGNDSLVYTTGKPSPLAYYFINGEGTPAGAVANYSLLTGRQPLPPFWALGYITSKYGYHNDREALGAIDSLKRRGHPVDGLVLDLYWYGKETDMGRLEWNTEQWPDHRATLDSLRRSGVNTILISQPYINKIGALDNYNFLAEKGMLTRDSLGRPHDVTTWVGEAGMFDMSNPDTRRWLAERYMQLTDDGVAAWWGDLGEPEVHPDGIRHANGLSARQYHNQYGNDWCELISDAWKEKYPDRRLMLLMRGGTAGLQRYGVMPWSTDVSRSWGGLEPQVRIMLGAGLSGLGYMGSDVGGFAVDPETPTNPELYVRWLEAGTFSPILRTHAQDRPEPYHYPEYADITRRYIRMRYQWLPYNYTLAFENTAFGLPLARPLNFYGDPSGRYAEVSDEYLWGDEVLVAPVVTPGATRRKVIFPEGERWYSWWNAADIYPGGSEAETDAPLGTLPLFVRAGAFIPQYDIPIENTTGYNPGYLTVRYYPSDKRSGYTLFDDDKQSASSLDRGAVRLTRFEGRTDSQQTVIDLHTTGNGYEGMPDSQEITFEIMDCQPPRDITIDGLPAKGDYDPGRRILRIVMTWQFKPTELKISY